VGYLPGHINPGLASVLTEVVPVLFLFVVLLVIPAARLAPAAPSSRSSDPTGPGRAHRSRWSVAACARPPAPSPSTAGRQGGGRPRSWRATAYLCELAAAIAAGGVTVVLVEQFAETALGVADRAAIMLHGRIVHE